MRVPVASLPTACNHPSLVSRDPSADLEHHLLNRSQLVSFAITCIIRRQGTLLSALAQRLLQYNKIEQLKENEIDASQFAPGRGLVLQSQLLRSQRQQKGREHGQSKGSAVPRKLGGTAARRGRGADGGGLHGLREEVGGEVRTQVVG